jgi:transposase
LDDGRTWDDIAHALYCSTRTIARWVQRWQRQGLQALPGLSPGPPRRFGAAFAALLVHWVLHLTPRTFGLFRSRWCCQTLVLLLWQLHGIVVSRETVRRSLHEAHLVWRRPRPVLRRQDPLRAEKLTQLRRLLEGLPDDETVVFEDEVDLNLNPKIGSLWMPRGRQAEVVTPGDNEKCYAAGSLHWRSGKLFLTVGPKRNGERFVRHLHDLRRQLRRYTKIHVICDNAKFHYDCAAVWEFCYRYQGRVELHFLPKYAPETNPIERIWWVLHEQVTRNHQCQTLQELVDFVLGWLGERQTFTVEDEIYREPQQAQAA